MSQPILYIGSSCPFCIRVVQFLRENNLEIEIRDVWTNDEYMSELQQMTGKTQVPYLRMGEQGMHESLDIIEKLKALYLA